MKRNGNKRTEAGTYKIDSIKWPFMYIGETCINNLKKNVHESQRVMMHNNFLKAQVVQRKKI